MKRSISVRAPIPRDEHPFLEAVAASRRLHRPWVKPPDTPSRFSAYLERLAQPRNESFLVLRDDASQLAGVINITNIVRGVFQSGYLDYYAFAGCDRQGFMRAGLTTVTRRAFRHLGLHRLEANIQPANAASIGLVKACGFSKEGYSPRYLKIGGRWRDHERWAILASR